METDKTTAHLNCVINIAFIGNAGTGKSSLINAIRNVKADDPNGADVGGVETTRRPTPYMYLDNPNIVLWDLPGVGTSSFPKETYLSDVSINKYCIFIIVSSSRFTENDMWLARTALRTRKIVFFVRTMIGVTIRSLKKAKPYSFKAHEALSQIKKYNEQHLNEAGSETAKLFLVDSYLPTQFEFSAFISELVNAICTIGKNPELYRSQTRSVQSNCVIL